MRVTEEPFLTGIWGDTAIQFRERRRRPRALEFHRELTSRINKSVFSVPPSRFPHHPTSMLTAAALALSPGLQTPLPLCSSVGILQLKCSSLRNYNCMLQWYIPVLVWRIVYALKWLLKWHLKERGLESMQYRFVTKQRPNWTIATRATK